MFLLEDFQADVSAGCLWSRAVSRFSPLKDYRKRLHSLPIYAEVQVVRARTSVQR